jgi:uncharacterized protein DUF3135
MKSFDELKVMPDQERLAHLHEEVEKVITSASPNSQLKLRALQAKCDHVRRQYSANPYVASAKIYDTMWSSFTELDDALQYHFGVEARLQ